MSNRLIVLVDPHWPQQPVADWVLLDAAGRCLERGRGEPRHWPPAERCEAVLDGTQTVWPSATLPPAPRRERARLLAFALEEWLVRDPEQEHVTLTHSHSADTPDGRGTRTAAIVVARTRLRQLCGQFAALGRPLRHLYSALQTTPHVPGRWVAAIGPGACAVLRTDAGTAHALDLGADDAAAALADQLALALDEARRAEAPPTAIELRAAAGTALPDATALRQALGLAVEPGPAREWWLTDSATDLLHGEFAPRDAGRLRWRRLRAPAWLAAASLGLLLAAGVADLLGQRGEHRKLQARAARILAEALPGTPVVAPAQQLRRALDDERARRGRLVAADLLALLAPYAAGGGRAPQALDYADGRLTLTLAAPAAPELVERLALHGIAARVEGATVTLAPAP